MKQDSHIIKFYWEKFEQGADFVKKFHRLFE